MNNAFGKVMAIIGSVFVLFLSSQIIIALKMESMAQSNIDSAIVEFVDKARSTAIITDSTYEEMCRKIDAVQSNCTVEIVHSSKYIMYNGVELETLYYDYHKPDILNVIYTPTGDNQKYKLQSGDFVSVTVYNNSPTLATQLYRMLMPNYNPSGVSIYSTYSGYVGNNAE